MAKPTRRQHYIARFYLRNFAEPVFSDSLCVYDLQKHCWERRTPNGVGWFPHLCSMIAMDGSRTDEFDKFLNREVENPAAPAMRKLATGEELDSDERSAVALFIALTAARSPQMMNTVMQGHLDRMSEAGREELEGLAKLWCQWTGKLYDSNTQSEFLKPSSFGAIWSWSKNLQNRLLQWDWHLVTTTRSEPFITSDRPVFAQWDQVRDIRLVGFSVSSEVALIITNGQLDESRDRSQEVPAMNRQTMHLATEFVVACKESFPADDELKRRHSVPDR